MAYDCAVRTGGDLPSLGRRGEGWVVAQVLLAAIVALGEILGPRWPEPLASALFAAGVVVAVAGLVLLLGGTAALGRSLTPFPKPKDAASLSEAGAYAFVRHPIYGGVILGFAGWSLARTPLGLFLTAVVVGFLELKSRREEAWLATQYRAYDDYRKRVRWKFVPGIL